MADYNQVATSMFGQLNKEERNESLADEDIMEIELEKDTDRKNKKQRIDVKRAACDNKECILSVGSKIALSLCYFCNLFLCEGCLRNHDKSHGLVRVENGDNERKKIAYELMGRMRSERTRESSFYVEDAKVYARVNVNHAFDRVDCYITGSCGLQEKRWVAVDSNNSCIKIFCSVTITLLRYVRFGSEPYDVTEIKQKSIVQNSTLDSKSRGACRDEQNKQCLLAVTFPSKKRVWFIDVNKFPAVKTKIIQVQTGCNYIDFSQDKIFTIGDLAEYVNILTAEGITLKSINLDLRADIYSGLAVCYYKIYVTCRYNDKVFCINAEDGETISHIHIKQSGVKGICLDPSNNILVCGQWHHKVYKLSSELREIEPLSLDLEYTQHAWNICYTDSKLFVSHMYASHLRNFITVIQLT